jgi:pyrimidine deaminase RibD-like protein
VTSQKHVRPSKEARDRPRYMEMALALAREARGHTNPNPPVGAVFVKEDRIIGQGKTQPPGGPHAEVMALADAKNQARDSTVFVTLEPCCVWGQTPPCTDALIAAGVKEAFVGVLDPNPRVNGRGVDALRAAHIEVHLAEHCEEALELIAPHAKFITTGLPLVTVLKSSCPEERRAQFRACADAVMIDPVEDSLQSDLKTCLTRAASRGILSIVLLERQPVAAALLDAGLVDRIIGAEAISSRVW